MTTHKLKQHKLKTATLISSALSLLLLTTTSPSYAKDKKEKCAGVVKAGLNDCASEEHICAGMNSDDGNETDWLWLPTGTCKKIAGAHLINIKKANVENSEKTKKKEKKKS